MHDRIMDVLKPLIALHLGRRTGVQRAAGLREFVGFLRQVITELETEASQIERGVCFTKEQVRP